MMKWHPLPKDLELHQKALDDILYSWKGTPYLEGSQKKGIGGGTDCVRFCCGVVDELFGYKRCPISHLPSDAAFNDPETTFEAMRALKRLYDPLSTVSPLELEPGDLLVTGPVRGGPGHLMIVGGERARLWHQTKNGVTKTGLGLPNDYKLFRIYRFQDRNKWVFPK